MEFKPIPCHESLLPFIRNYWILSAQCTATGTQQIFSNGATSLHFYLSQEVRLEDNPNNLITSKPHDLKYRTALNRHDIGCMGVVTEEGPLEIFGVEFVPFCARMFFHFDATTPHIMPEDTDDEEFQAVSNAIHSAASDEERKALLDDFFCKRLSEIPADDINLERMNDVFQQIVPTDGSVAHPPVGHEEFTPNDLASTACLSQKQFTRVFNKYVGMNPKTYLRLLRFNKALMELRKNAAKVKEDSASMTEVAWSCGYYDLAHMTSDFRSLSGYSPSEMLAAGAKLTETFGPQFSGLMKKKIKIENVI